MTKLVKAKFKVGDVCVCEHHYAFRSSEPFRVVSITYTWVKETKEHRFCYVVQYRDNILDAIPVESQDELIMKYSTFERKYK